MLKIISYLVLLILIGIMPALADMPPRPQSKTKALSAIEDEITATKQNQTALDKAAKEAETALNKVKKQIVSFADDIRESEFALTQLEEKIASLTKEERDLTISLEKEYGSIAELILALERIRRLPPETLIMRPGAPLETAQSALLLKSVLPVVKNQAHSISKDLVRLSDIQKNLSEDRLAALDNKERLDKRYEDMQVLLKKRETLYAQTDKDRRLNMARIKALSKEAKNLQDLLDKIAEAEKQQALAQRAAAAKTSTDSQRPRKAVSNMMPAAGQARLPVTGFITVGYGQRDDIGAKSEGVRIETRPSAIVVAPMGGVVRYSGFFKNYGNIVIIEHKGGYHSLIGGLEVIEVNILNSVRAGEVVGRLPKQSSYGAAPSLYYELRYNGKSVNPSKKFSELKS